MMASVTLKGTVLKYGASISYTELLWVVTAIGEYWGYVPTDWTPALGWRASTLGFLAYIQVVLMLETCNFKH